MATTTNTTKTWNTYRPAGSNADGLAVHTEGFDYFVTVSGTAGCAGEGADDCGPGSLDFLATILCEESCAA